MWWQNKKLLVVCGLWLVAGVLTSCGFETMYGSHAGKANTGAKLAGVEIGDIQIGPTGRRVAQQFRAELEDRLNPVSENGRKQYRLDVALTTEEVGLAVTRTGTFSRYMVNVIAEISLTRLADGALVYQAKALRGSPYNNEPNAYYSTYVASQDAVKRATTELAEDVRMRMATFLASNANPQPISPTPARIPIPYENYRQIRP